MRKYDIMRFTLTTLVLLLATFASYSKDVKIVVSPSEAVIKVNGSYYGEGSTVVKIKKNDFVIVEASAPGYETINTRIYGNDDRKTVELKLKEDMLLKQTVESSLANKFFTVKVSKSLYTDDENTGERNAEQAWKLAHNILLNYIDEIQTSDMASGYIQTPYYIKNYVEAGKTLRSRVTIKETNIGGDLTFQIKLSSEIAPIQGRNREESYQETSRLIKEFEPLISEFQTRLGEK